MRFSNTIVLGTRGSELARAQTLLAQDALHAAFPDLRVEIKIIATQGDKKSGAESIDRRAGRKGLFTSEIERCLLVGEIDVAIHSAKDLPSDATADLEIVAALPRAAADDVLVTEREATLAALPLGATVATGSVRRQRQIRAVRADLKLEDLRGNVPTRLRKLKTNAWNGIVLAQAGLERLGHDCAAGEFLFEGELLHATQLPPADFLPAGGQGIIALQVRADEGETRATIERLNHVKSLLSLRAEREFLRLLQGNCGTPVGVLAQFQGGMITMRAQIFDEDSLTPRVAELTQSRAGDRPESLAAELLELINAG